MPPGLLDVLSEEDRRGVLRVARRRRFARNEVVFHQGDPGESVHVVVRGHVAVRISTPLGDSTTVRVLGPGSLFGELAVIAPAPRNATVVALEAAETLSLHRDELEAVRRSHPAVDRFLLEGAVADLRRVSELLIEALYVPVEQRLYRRLLDLANLYRPSDGGTVAVPLTQEDLAQLAGTTRQTANKVLREAEEAGALRMGRGRIEVVDPDALGRRAH